MIIEYIDLPILGDERGSLIALEEKKNIPFKIKRVYYIYGTKHDVTRGLHAHKTLNQVAVCVNGSCKMTLDDGIDKKTIILDNPAKGIVIRKMIWRKIFDFSDQCVLLVLASQLYDELDYIRNYDEFIKLIKRDIKKK